MRETPGIASIGTREEQPDNWHLRFNSAAGGPGRNVRPGYSIRFPRLRRSRVGLTRSRYFALTLVAATAGCVSGGQYQSALDFWIGSGEPALVDQFGPPKEVVEEGDGRILKWESAREVEDRTSAPAGGGIAIGLTTTTIQYCRLSAHLAGDGTVDRFEWKATQSAPFNKDKEIEPVFGLAVGCANSFPAEARNVKPHSKLEPWKGRSADDLVAAYSDEPAVYVSDDQTRWLTWSDAGSRTSVGVPQQPDPDVKTTRQIRSLCSVSFGVVDGIVDRYNVRGQSGCPMPTAD